MSSTTLARRNIGEPLPRSSTKSSMVSFANSTRPRTRSSTTVTPSGTRNRSTRPGRVRGRGRASSRRTPAYPCSFARWSICSGVRSQYATSGGTTRPLRCGRPHGIGSRDSKAGIVGADADPRQRVHGACVHSDGLRSASVSSMRSTNAASRSPAPSCTAWRARRRGRSRSGTERNEGGGGDPSCAAPRYRRNDEGAGDHAPSVVDSTRLRSCRSATDNVVRSRTPPRRISAKTSRPSDRTFIGSRPLLG